MSAGRSRSHRQWKLEIQDAVFLSVYFQHPSKLTSNREIDYYMLQNFDPLCSEIFQKESFNFIIIDIFTLFTL